MTLACFDEASTVCVLCVFQESGETVLHYCVRTSDHTSLHLVDFLVQNRYGGDIVRHHRAPQNLLISSNRL